MKAFLWYGVDECSCSYHKGGSVLIEAETIERAREIAFFDTYDISDGYKEIKKPITDISIEPDAIFDSHSTEEKVWIFPDAGCC